MNTSGIDTAAAKQFVDVFTAADFAGDVGPRMSCTEVDALAGMLRAVGADTAADTWVSGHAEEDQEGDNLHQA
ncbi:hypothetical protein E3T25_04635 [Cryobacterium sandaracinum]|uniref:Uncharacterized protein n=1 Tax=Cryobacterium sandaracinum TaxID=1259247 RepID=A0ABY2JGG9_9MICO|nr:hypothetical protein [Cryobacterium sandaracinum]TFD05192.1 hypothetical protein E3T25_04635 [Cryobacterium sandaracinum]